jgi:predicted flap endonuclease-1-like 5' DNA nuclease
MAFLWFLLGLLVGAGVLWFILTRQSDQRVQEAEVRAAHDLEHATNNANEADLAHRETKERLIALQFEHQKLEQRAKELEARLEALPAGPAPADGAAALEGAGRAAGERRPAAGPADGPSEDLKQIKGIGPTLERQLNELGITTIRQLADLKQDEIDRINASLAFAGRVERERWIEQARQLLAR